MKRWLTLCLCLCLTSLWGQYTFETPQEIASDSFDVQAFDVAINDSGQAAAIWIGTLLSSASEDVKAVSVTYVSYYNGTIWQSTVVPNSTPIEGSVSIGIDADGNASAVYVNSGGLSPSFVRNVRFDSSLALTIETISDTLKFSNFPVIKVNPSGQAYASWFHPFIALNTPSFASEQLSLAYRYFNGTSWTPANEVVITPTAPNDIMYTEDELLAAGVTNQGLAIDSAGNGVLAWAEGISGTSVEIFATQLTGATNSTPTTLTTTPFDNTRNVLGLSAATNGSRQYVTFNVGIQQGLQVLPKDVYYNTFDGSSWQSESIVLFSENETLGLSTSVCIDSNGTGLVAWSEVAEGGNIIIDAAKLTNSTFEVFQNLSGAGLEGQSFAYACLDNSGTCGIVTWQGSDGNNEDGYYNDFDQTSFSIPIALNLGGTATDLGENPLPGLVVKVSPGAKAIAAELLGADSQGVPFGLSAVIGECIPEGGVLPPQNLRGKCCIDKYLTQTELSGFLTWQASSSDNIVAYKIYCDGCFICSVPGDQLCYRVGNKSPKKKVYSVVAVNSSGVASTPVSICL